VTSLENLDRSIEIRSKCASNEPDTGKTRFTYTIPESKYDNPVRLTYTVSVYITERMAIIITIQATWKVTINKSSCDAKRLAKWIASYKITQQ